MIVLTYGLKKPQTGDKGSVFFPALEDNFTQLDAHNHNGVNSPLLTTASLSTVTQSISSASWVAVSGQAGTYRQLVTTPLSITSLDPVVVTFKEAVSKDVLFLTYEKQSANTYYVYINDNTLDLIANYGV